MMHPQGPNKAACHTPLVSTAVGEHGPRVDLGGKALVLSCECHESRPVINSLFSSPLSWRGTTFEFKYTDVPFFTLERESWQAHLS